MKLKTAVKYRYSSFAGYACAFYLILSVFFIVGKFFEKAADTELINPLYSYTFTGAFMFVAGLLSFKTQFKFLSQCGVIRIKQFQSFLLLLFAAIPCAAINVIIKTLLTLNEVRPYYFTLLIFGDYLNMPLPAYLFYQFVTLIFMFVFALSLGFFLSALYYRMKPVMKLLVSLVVPTLFLYLFMGFSALDFNGIYKRTSLTVMEKLYYGSMETLFGSGALGFNIISHIVLCGLMSVVFICASFIVYMKVNVKRSRA